MSWQFCMYACTHMQTTLKGAGFHSVNRATPERYLAVYFRYGKPLQRELENQEKMYTQ